MVRITKALFNNLINLKGFSHDNQNTFGGFRNTWGKLCYRIYSGAAAAQKFRFKYCAVKAPYATTAKKGA